MALGELMATRLGAAYLEKSGLSTQWMDARKMLTSSNRSNRAQPRDYLSATCDHEADEELQQQLANVGCSDSIPSNNIHHTQQSPGMGPIQSLLSFVLL